MKENLNNTKPYCMYLRKSRKDLSCYSIQEVLRRHKEQLLTLAKYYHIHILDENIYEEVVSGETIEDRPMIKQLLKEVEQGKWAGVFVMEIERLARGDTIDQGIVARAFHYSNTKIITLLKIYDPNDEYDEEYFEFGLFMSRREYKTINRRLQLGRRKSAEEGKWVNSTPPYGWKRKKIAKEKGYELIKEEQESKIVRLIYDLYLGNNESNQSYGIGTIAKYLNKIGIRPRHKNEWSNSSIRGILTNPVHCGKIVWGKRPLIKQLESGKMKKTHKLASNYLLTEGRHKKFAIISEEEFARTQQKLKKHQPQRSSTKTKLQNPLAGLIYCNECGSKLLRKKADGIKRKEDTLFCPKSNCKNKESLLSLVENRILNSLDQALKKYKISIYPIDKAKDNKKMLLSYFEKEIKKKQQQLNKSCELLEEGIYSKELFIEREKKLTLELKQLEQEKHQIKQKKKEINSISPKIPNLENLFNFYQENISIEQKNLLLHSLIDKVIYQKTYGGKKDKDNFCLTIYLMI